MKKNFIFLFICTVLVFFSCEKKLDAKDIAYIENTETEQNTQGKINYDVKYPVFEQHEVLNEEINTVLSYTKLLKDEIGLWEKDYSSSKHWFVRLAYDEPEIVGNYVTFLFYLSTYTGGKAPYTEIISINYDAKLKSILNLENIPEIKNPEYLKAISEYCTSELLQRLNSDKNFHSDEAWITSGASAELKNYEVFKVQKKGVEVIFLPYQVASYEVGPVYVTVPYSTLKK